MSYDYKQFRRRKLPHIHPPGALLFVTFRLAGSIPKAIIKECESERRWLEHELKRISQESGKNSSRELSNHKARLSALV